MTFEELLALAGRPDSPNVCVDSRLVKKGDIFVAVKGAHLDGHNFIDKALQDGAKYIVAQKGAYKAAANSNIIFVENSAKASALLAHAKKGNPADKLTCLAVTGTNGKTTVTYLVRSIIESAGFLCGMMGTVQYSTGLKTYQSKLTTPDASTVADIMNQMVDAGAKYMITEASSHALDQDRLAGLNFTAAAFTNLTGDHLDYHKTKENYLTAKSKLFESLSKEATAVLNKQSDESLEIAKRTNAKIMWYSIDTPADLTAYIVKMDTSGTLFSLEYNGQKHLVKSPLLGKYNVSNNLASAGLCLAAGFNLDTICLTLSNPAPPPGRLQKVPSNNGLTILVDYAHTDDALQNVLETLRPLCTSKLIVVFGCGGDRDRTKRPRMAKVVEKFADLAIVTSDNPRSENPQSIINEIVAGFENRNNQKIKVEPDRKTAIGIAIESANKNDIILIAGKGHENYQILADKTNHFSDQEVACEFLEEKK